jgi:hypothetical protein
MNVLNKLVFVPGKPFHPPSLWVIPGAYSRVERLKGVSHGLATASPTNSILFRKDLPGENDLAYYVNS